MKFATKIASIAAFTVVGASSILPASALEVMNTLSSSTRSEWGRTNATAVVKTNSLETSHIGVVDRIYGVDSVTGLNKDLTSTSSTSIVTKTNTVANQNLVSGYDEHTRTTVAGVRFQY